MVALGSFVGCLAVPGNFYLDTVCAATWIAHGFWGVEAMIGDYVPLIAPAVVAGVCAFNLEPFYLIDSNPCIFYDKKICEKTLFFSKKKR